MCFVWVFFSSRSRHSICALVTGVQTCALPICCASRLIRASGHSTRSPRWTTLYFLREKSRSEDERKNVNRENSDGGLPFSFPGRLFTVMSHNCDRDRKSVV